MKSLNMAALTSPNQFSLLDVFAICKANVPKSFQTFIFVHELAPGKHVMIEDFYNSKGQLLKSYREPLIANDVAPYNNMVIQDWRLSPSKGKNLLKVYLDHKLLGYSILYGE